MKIADLPVRDVFLGVTFKSQAHAGGRRLPPPSDALMADVRKLAALKRLPTPAELKRKYNLTVPGLGVLRDENRMPQLKDSVRKEVLKQYDAWLELKKITPTWYAVAEKHNVTHDTLMKLVAKELGAK